MDAVADAVVGAHGPGVDLGGAFVALGDQLLLLVSGGLDDALELLLLGLQVIHAHGDDMLEVLDGGLLVGDGHLGVVDVLLRYLAQVALVLDFLVDGVELAAVGDVLQLGLILGDLLVKVDDILLVGGDGLVELVDHFRLLGNLGLEVGDLVLERLDLVGKLTPELDDLVYGDIGLLKVIEDLEFLLYAQLRIREVLLQGNESLPLVYGCFHLLDFLGHIYRNCFFDYELQRYEKNRVYKAFLTSTSWSRMVFRDSSTLTLRSTAPLFSLRALSTPSRVMPLTLTR